VLSESIREITTRSRITISDITRELELDLELGLKLDLVLELETTLVLGLELELKLELKLEPGLLELGIYFDSNAALYRYILIYPTL
jgi:hypothetical protein